MAGLSSLAAAARVRAELVASEALDGGASSPRAAQLGPQPGGELPQAERSVATC
jgi:hypothetical protein